MDLIFIEGVGMSLVSLVVVLGALWYWMSREKDGGVLRKRLRDYLYILRVLRVPLIRRGFNWTPEDIPSLEGKVAVVTGSNGGIGYEVALGLAKAGAKVVLAVRNERKGMEAKERMLKDLEVTNVEVEVMKMDLCSLKSIEEFCEAFMEKYGELDVLVNNAGVMIPPRRSETDDGFELQFGTNHLGHFALTARLLPALRKRGGSSRVVNVSSLASHQGTVDFDDLMFNKRPVGFATYAQSKLANILFAREMHRRSEEGGWGVLSCAVHPGVTTYTGIVQNGPGSDSLLSFLSGCMGWMIFPRARVSAIPVLYGATCKDVQGGGYYGPKRLMEMRDGVKKAVVPPEARNADVALRLWDVSTQLTGVTWPGAE